MTISFSQSIAAASFALATLSAPLAAAELVMVDQPGCMYCAEWDAVLGPIYPKTPEGLFAPLRHVQKAVIEDAGVALERPVTYTPTFLLVEDDTEIGRIEGYPGEDFFWAMLKMMLLARTDYDPAQTAESGAE